MAKALAPDAPSRRKARLIGGYLRLLKVIPGDAASRSMADSECPLLKK